MLRTYELDPTAMSRLEETLRAVLSAAGSAGFTLRAAWVESAWQTKAPSDVRRLAFADLLADVRRNRIANNLEYVVDTSR